MTSQLLNGRYSIDSTLGSGADGTVFAVTDRLGDEPLALKLLASADGGGALRLRGEFRRLSLIDHRHVLVVRDLERAQEDLATKPPIERGTLFFTAERLSGPSLSGWLARQRDPLAILGCLEDLADALAACHAANLVHCDVKPSNVIIHDQRGPVLFDFGLAKARGRRGDARGTLAFMDERALLGEPDPMSDLHALGVSFYLGLAKTPPFEHADPATLAASLATEPAPLASHCPTLPGTLTEVIDSLIRRSSRARSASEVLDRLWSARESMDGAHGRQRRHRRRAGASRLVGREDVVAQLEAAVRYSSGPQPAVVALSAPPSAGCGAVLAELARRAQLRAIAEGASLEILRGDASRVGAELIAGTSSALAGLEGHQRLVASADAVIASLAKRARTRPLLWIDSGETKSELAAEVVRALASGHPGLANAAVTIVGRFDQLETADTACVSIIELAALSNSQFSEIATAILGEVPPPSWLHELVRTCARRPQAVVAALSAAAMRHEPLEEIDPRRLISAAEASSTALFLKSLAAALTPDALDVIAAVAILGRPVTAKEVAALISLDESHAERTVAGLLADEWLQSEGNLVFVSEARAQAAESCLGAARRKSLHRAALERTPVEAVAVRARHLLVVGPQKEALAELRRASEAHLKAGELERARAAAEIVLERAAGAEISAAALLAAQIHFELGDYKGGYQHAARASRSRDLAIRRKAQLVRATCRQRTGDLDDAERELDALLRRGPADHAVRGALAKVILLRGRYDDAKRVAGATEELLTHSDADGIELCIEAAGLAELYLGNAELAKRAFDAIAGLAAARGSDALGGRASALLGLAAHHGGDIVAAAKCYANAASAAERCGLIHSAASAQINRAAAEADRGRFVSALAALDAALVLLRRLGRVGDLPAALYNRAHCLFALGDLAGAEATAKRALEQARDTGRTQFEIYSHLILGDVARRRGDAASARREYDNANEGCERAEAALEVTSVALNLAELLAESGDRAALEQLTRAEQAGSDDAPRLYLSRARVSLALGAPDVGLLARLEPAIEDARTGGREDLYWRLSALAGRLAVAAGDRVRGRAHARAAVEELARTLAGIPASYHPGMRRDPDIVALAALDAELELSGIRSAHSDAAADNDSVAALHRLLALSSRLNSETRLEALLDQVIDTAIELAGAERGFLLLREHNELALAVARNIDQRALGTSDGAAVSRSIAQRAAESGEVVLALDAAFDERWGSAESVAAMRLRSVLAVPLRYRSELIGTLYLDHRFRTGAFDERAVRLIRELANIAGVALGNARIAQQNRERAAEIAALNERLEEELSDRETELAVVRARLPADEDRDLVNDIVGTSLAIRELHKLVERMANTTLPVVITGESGTGKELVARALHRLSRRHRGPFVAVNCGAVAESLLESELFGHVRGAFTGADRLRRGHFEVADGGTLFLDEIADTSAAMQAKLLRVLQEGEIRRLGDEQLRRVDVRVVAASNRDLQAQMKAGLFREDLFFRLKVLSITVPPLRDRATDIPELVAHLLRRNGAQATTVSREAMALLCTYRWPGNVRELENELTRAAALADGRITADDLSPSLTRGGGPSRLESSVADLDLKKRVELLERELIEAALGRCGGNQTRAAKALGLSRYGLQKKLKRLGER